MPFCEDCAKYWAPSAMTEDGSCPSCGRRLEDQRTPLTRKTVDVRRLAEGDDPGEARAPWHFRLLIVLLALYLGWRVVDLFV